MDQQREPVLFYEREFYPFSNFSSFAIDYKGHRWMTSEHAYHAEKFTDPEIIQKIKDAPSAHECFRLSREYADHVRPEWWDERVAVMEKLMRIKLEQHEYVQKKLRETGDREIIEDSSKDSFWGWGPDQKGENQLGKVWMRLREELRQKDTKSWPKEHSQNDVNALGK